MADNRSIFDNFPFFNFSDIQFTDVIRNAVTMLRCSACILCRSGKKTRTGRNRSTAENNESGPDE